MPVQPRPIADRYWEKVDRLGPDECWPWTGATRGGHGVLSRGPKGAGLVQAHRLAWEFEHGFEPTNDVDHTCHNLDPSCSGGVRCLHRRCQNPAHLRDVTRGENLRGSALTNASRQLARTHCPAGHPYDDENTYRYRGMRYCRACKRGSRSTTDTA